MTDKNVEAIIRKTGIIAIIRGNYGIDTLLKIADTLARGGVQAIEVTLNSAGALAGITALRKAMTGDAVIGAGTVRTASQVQAAMDAGAQFLISPNLDLPSVTLSQKHGVLHLPGVFTASEVQMAFAAGCEMVKLFPAHMLGPAYIKALLAPLNDVAFVPTGGINEKNAQTYITAGAVALGVGSALVQGPDQDMQDLLNRAKLMRQAVDNARNAAN
ncbi:MAG: bifunctional 4-hydroxy-2-oxoglutarate aldolase/2-dehydro-3-deoxy-phosphogluconate aldolase [Rhodothermales bacterium]